MDISLEATGLLIMVGAPAYIALQVWLALRLRGGWRKAALTPLLLAIPLFAWCAYAFADNSNLWPVPFLLFAPFGAAYLIIIYVASRPARAV